MNIYTKIKNGYLQLDQHSPTVNFSIEIPIPPGYEKKVTWGFMNAFLVRPGNGKIELYFRDDWNMIPGFRLVVSKECYEYLKERGLQMQ